MNYIGQLLDEIHRYRKARKRGEEFDPADATHALDCWLADRMATYGFIGPKLAETIIADRPNGEPIRTEMPTIGDVVFWYAGQASYRTELRTARVTGSYKTPGGLEHVVTDFHPDGYTISPSEIYKDRLDAIEARLSQIRDEESRLLALRELVVK